MALDIGRKKLFCSKTGHRPTCILNATSNTSTLSLNLKREVAEEIKHHKGETTGCMTYCNRILWEVKARAAFLELHFKQKGITRTFSLISRLKNYCYLI